MKAFEYFAPRSLAEATEVLARYQGEARTVAGGTDLLLKMKAGRLSPKAIVNIKRVPELRGLTFNSHLTLGALTTLEEIKQSSMIRERYPALSDAAATMASVQIRNLATVGGNLCNAAPSADLAPILIALNAAARLAGFKGERRIPLEDFFTGPGTTVLAPGELLVSLEVPPPAGPSVYLKHSPREHMDIAVVGIGLALRGYNPLSQECAEPRVVLGAVAPVPLRARRAEAELTGGPLAAERIDRAAKIAAEEAKPIDDVRGSAWYRRRMVAVLTRRGLETLTRADKN
ncbi:MAG: FAD-binding PCMH-type protein [Anaerolineales bacterium]|nr:FAD-binding PCMH-type protein [Anaerolineales bacterium]MBM2848451.1 FAD-binding PCMH-type protein [Anaerolineales bacterium]